MSLILYSGFDNIDSIKNRLTDNTFLNVAEKDITTSLNDADLILVGPLVKDPIKVTQEISKKDRRVSIVLLPGADRLKETKQSLLFSPFLNKDTRCLAYDQQVFKELESVLIQSQQRKLFSKINVDLKQSVSKPSQNISLEYLGNFLEQAPIGAVLLNSDFNIVGINSFARRLFNLQPLQQVKTLKEIIEPAYLENVLQNIHAHSTKPFELVSGNQFFEVTLAEVKSEKGEALDILLITNVTERKLEDQRMRSVLDALPQMAWTTNSIGEVTYLTARWYQYTGQSYAQAISNGWQVVLHPDDKSSFLQHWQKAIVTAKPFECEARYRRADGVYRWHLVRGIPILTSLNKLNYWLGTCTDIDDHKLLEKGLEEIVKIKTEELKKATDRLNKKD